MTIKTGLLLAAAMLLVGCDATRPITELPDNPRNILLRRITGQSQEAAIVTLCRTMHDDADPAVRRDAIVYLASYGPEATAAIEPLIEELLTGNDARLHAEIQRTLQAIGAACVPELLAAFDAADSSAQLRIVDALAELGPAASESLPRLRQLLAGSEPSLQLAAIEALQSIGPAARACLPDLIILLESPRAAAADADRGAAYRHGRGLQAAAVHALLAIGPDARAVPGLRQALGREPQIAAPAARALALLGPQAAAAIPELEQLVQRDDHGGKDIKTRLAREAAAEALSIIAPTTKQGNVP